MGGTVDPKTGNVSWHMNVPLEEQLTFYRSHPPRALENLRTTAIEQVDWSFDGHGEPINSIFELACTCGGSLFTVTCGIDPDEEVAPPIALECAACEAAFDIFDANQHGWNAVMCGDTFDEPDISDDLVGNSIGAPHEIIVRFEHASDTLGDSDLSGREQDVFTWFTLLARDPNSKSLEQLFDWECA